jgi:uncharacterized OsmC-like protein
MDAETLRNRQAPLKKEYREYPEKALITHKAQGKLGDDVTCHVPTQNGTAVSGLHPAAGGEESVACSGDMLLQSLTACAGVTLNAVATNMGIEIEDATIDAEGEIDFRGTLGVSKSAPVGFKQIRLQFDLVTPAEASKVEKLIELTERFCVIYQTLKEGVDIQTSFTLHEPN